MTRTSGPRMSAQLPLDDWLPGMRLARARRTDPESSHAAADQAEADGTIATHALVTLGAVRRLPGLTSKQLAGACELDRYQIARRLPELERRGLVRRVSNVGGERWFPA